MDTDAIIDKLLDALDTLDEATRKKVREHQRLVRDSPSLVAFSRLVNHHLTTYLLNRMGKRLGWPLSYWQWSLLLTAFGRDPGYPYNLLWQPNQRDPKAEVDKAVRRFGQDMIDSLRRPPGSDAKRASTAAVAEVQRLVRESHAARPRPRPDSVKEAETALRARAEELRAEMEKELKTRRVAPTDPGANS